MTNTTAVAHVVTADAVALGAPELIVMTPADEPSDQPRVIERHPLGTAESLRGLDELLPDHGWRATGDPTYVDTGYVLVAVERV